MPLFLYPAHQQQNEQDDDDETKPTTPGVAGPVEWAAADTTTATEKCDDQNDENNCADAHLNPPNMGFNAQHGTLFHATKQGLAAIRPNDALISSSARPARCR